MGANRAMFRAWPAEHLGQRHAFRRPVGGPLPRGNLLTLVSLGAAVAFVEGQPAGEPWRFTVELGDRELTAEDMQRIWQTPEFWGWVAAHG